MRNIFFTTLTCLLVSCNQSTPQSEANNTLPPPPQPLSEQNQTEHTHHRVPEEQTYLKLVHSGQTNQLGNPVFYLYLYHDSTVIQKLPTVSGRAYTQNRDRNISGNESPLPNGRYTVSHTPIPGSRYETGDVFLPIEPQFETQRFALGFHYDPSYNRSNGEDGTAGCIGFINKEDFNTFLDSIDTYQPTYLIVNI